MPRKGVGGSFELKRFKFATKAEKISLITECVYIYIYSSVRYLYDMSYVYLYLYIYSNTVKINLVKCKYTLSGMYLL